MGNIMMSDDVYYLSQTFRGQPTTEGANPIAEGISIYQEEEKDERGLWGYLSWFDKIHGSMQTIALVAPPKFSDKDIFANVSEELIYSFQYVTLQVFDNHLRHLFQLDQPPPFSADEDVQKFIKKLNPY